MNDPIPASTLKDDYKSEDEWKQERIFYLLKAAVRMANSGWGIHCNLTRECEDHLRLYVREYQTRTLPDHLKASLQILDIVRSIQSCRAKGYDCNDMICQAQGLLAELLAEYPTND